MNAHKKKEKSNQESMLQRVHHTFVLSCTCSADESTVTYDTHVKNQINYL